MTNTYIEIVEADDTNPNTIKEPAKRWRNWYKVQREYRSRQHGVLRKPGDIIPGLKVWPSKDAAETWAAAHCNHPDYADAKHICTLPEGERP